MSPLTYVFLLVASIGADGGSVNRVYVSHLGLFLKFEDQRFDGQTC